MTEAGFGSPGDNPFASPQVGGAAIDAALPVLERRRPWALLFVGIVVGAIVGATAGGVTSGVIGFVGMAMQQAADRDADSLQITSFSPWAALFVGGLLGGFNGAWMGGIIGGIVGLVSGTAVPLRMKLPMWLGAALSAIGGGFFGVVAVHFVFFRGRRFWDFHGVALVVGGLLGVAAGLIAGAFLGRVLYGMAVRWRGVGLASPLVGLLDRGPDFVTPHPLDLRERGVE